MPFLARPLAVLSAFIVCLSATFAHASALEPLSDADARFYRAAFAAADHGDFDAAEAALANTRDKSLTGRLVYSRLMHPSAHMADYAELSAWLASYGDQAGADRVYALALKRKPARAPAPRAPALFVTAAKGPAPADKARAAREAYYSGDVKRALTLAQSVGEPWIAGLAAYRLQSFAQARTAFERVANDDNQDEWLRAAAAFWAARSAAAAGQGRDVEDLLNQAARAPNTFYGMIAARQLALAGQALAQDDPIAALLTKVSYDGPDVNSLGRLLSADPRARRAAALAQVGRWTEAGQELRAGLSLASDDPRTRADWSELALALNEKAPLNAGRPVKRVGNEDYPLPPLEPKGGFTIDKAMVYALVRQESRFDPYAISGAGATGLMQLMPVAAARAAGDDKLLADTTPLLDPSFNLRVGQDYFTWLMDRGLQSPDLFRAVAAYNGGPGTLIKTQEQLGGADCDPLLLIESLPAQETRNYVEKVMASYWTYRKLMGAETKTLDAVASGARVIDFRLDQ
ncbi:MAG: lytic transglycosylase domain-containing protein [Caulobacter sp.]|nr:lytic transglycosylase domain-containing protein [Caulobacter sp.]